ncbi:MAG: hypothetical protein EAZ79_01215, partial [Oscillatoriales cyanobacterium]|uniref:hypothetical protein n=1 Tax=unclassified Microcoleus TaxID=2642155 RepID=UPI0025DAFD57
RTVALLKAQGNMSEAVDKLIELCIVGAVRHDGCLNPISFPGLDVTNSESKDAHSSIEAIALPEPEIVVAGYYPPPPFWTRTYTTGEMIEQGRGSFRQMWELKEGLSFVDANGQRYWKMRCINYPLPLKHCGCTWFYGY